MSGLLYSPEPFFIFQTCCLENDPKAVCCLRKKQQAKQSALPSWCWSEKSDLSPGGAVGAGQLDPPGCLGLSPARQQCWEGIPVRELVGPGVRQDRQLPGRASCKAQPGQGGVRSLSCPSTAAQCGFAPMPRGVSQLNLCSGFRHELSSSMLLE